MELTSRKNDTVRRFKELARDKKLRDELGEVFFVTLSMDTHLPSLQFTKIPTVNG